MVVQCCICGKIREGDDWRFAFFSELEDNPVSTGYCPECAAHAFEAIKEARALETDEWPAQSPAAAQSHR